MSTGVSADAVNSAIARSIANLRTEMLRALDQRHDLIRASVGAALGEIMNELEENAKHDLEEAITKLRIEVTMLESSIAELRTVIASEKARVIAGDAGAGKARSGLN